MNSREAKHYRVEGTNPYWNDPQYLYPIDVKFKKMRDWQVDAFELGKDARFFAVQAFCGSGKSILQVNLAIHDIVSSGYKQKQLIVVPQQHIHRGFVGEDDIEYLLVNQNGIDYQWNIQSEHNFCDGDERVIGLVKWLLMPSDKLSKGFRDNSIGGLNAICSHQALVAAWKLLKTDKEKKQAIRNLTLRIDEAHHINLVFLESEDFSDEEQLAIDCEMTELGRICTFIVNSKIASAKLHLTTATMYRGDRRIVLSKEVRDKFVQYNLDWIKHFQSLGIESFYLQYEEYVGDPIDQIVERIKAEPNEKHFVVVPPTGNKWRKNGDEYQELLSKLSKLKARVLDLITPSTQNKNKKLLLAEPKFNDPNNPSKYDVIVVCMLGREGTDWCPCSRLHNSSCENSITLAIQTVGRPFRRYDGKTDVHIYHYVKKFTMPKKGISKRELLTDRTNALLVCMQIDDMQNPILIPVFPNQQESEKSSKEGKPKTTTLDVEFGDQYENVLRDCFEQYELLEEKNKASVRDLATKICISNGIDETHANFKNIRDALAVRIIREVCPELKLAGIDIEFMRHAGYDRIEFDNSIWFGNYKGQDFQIVREIIKGDYYERFLEVKRIGLENIKPDHPLHRFVQYKKYDYRKSI